MPDVKMPDGTIIRNVPEGTTRAQLMARVSKAQSDNTARNTPVGALDAFGRGAADLAAFGLADKISAAGNAVLPIDRLAGRDVKSVWDGTSFLDAFSGNLALENRTDTADAAVNPVARTAGQVAGALVGPVPGRGLIAKGAARLGKTAPLAKVVGEAAVQSGLYGAGKGNSASVGERLDTAWKDALKGSAGALGGYGLIRGGARLISPKVSNEVASLANSGIVMTPGQRGGRVAKFIEQASESIPFVGTPIKAAKARGVQQFNKAWTNEALKPIGVKVPNDLPAGEKAVGWAQKAVSDAYQKALSGISAPIDNTFKNTIKAVSGQVRKLPSDQAKAFSTIMQLRVAPLLKGKTALDGKTMQQVDRALQKDIAGFRSKGDPIADLTADMLDDVRGGFLDLAGRHAGPNATAYKAAKEASARLARVEDAASRPNSVKGVFTPSTAASAAARKGYGTTTKNLARGEARMQKLADAAKAVLPDTLPDSGTATRGAWMTALGLAGSGGAGATVSPAAGLLALPLAKYIPGIDRVTQKVSLRGQSPAARRLADEIRQRAYIGGMLGTAAPLKKRD